jgi:D-alanine-D-alanine ligase
VKIGLCYDLRDEYLAAGYGEEETAEFDSLSTLEAIESALRSLGHRTERVGGVRALAAQLTGGARFDLVFNIAEGLEGFGREAQVPALLEAFGIAYTFSDPLVCSLTLHKAMTKRVLRDAGIPTPAFHLVEELQDLEAVELDLPLFVKPVAEGTAKGIDASSRVESREALGAACRRVLARYRQPALVEEYLPGREFTTGILGSGRRARALGTLEVTLRPGAEPHSCTYQNKERCEELCDYAVADASQAAPVERLALDAWRVLSGRDAGRVDLRLDADGRPQVMEVNALPGLHPTHSDLPMIATAVGTPYNALIRAIVESAALRRSPAPRAAPAPLPTARLGLR